MQEGDAVVVDWDTSMLGKTETGGKYNLEAIREMLESRDTESYKEIRIIAASMAVRLGVNPVVAGLDELDGFIIKMEGDDKLDAYAETKPMTYKICKQRTHSSTDLVYNEGYGNFKDLNPVSI